MININSMKYIILFVFLGIMLVFSHAFSDTASTSETTVQNSNATSTVGKTSNNPTQNKKSIDEEKNSKEKNNIKKLALNTLSGAIKAVFSWVGFALLLVYLFHKEVKDILISLAGTLRSTKLKKAGSFEFDTQHNENTKEFEENSEKSGEKPTIYGDPDEFKLICKASNSRFTKSTKALNLPDGCLIQVSTRELIEDGTISVAEAISYVPGVQVNIEHQEEGVKVEYKRLTNK